MATCTSKRRSTTLIRVPGVRGRFQGGEGSVGETKKFVYVFVAHWCISNSKLLIHVVDVVWNSSESNKSFMNCFFKVWVAKLKKVACNEFRLSTLSNLETVFFATRRYELDWLVCSNQLQILFSCAGLTRHEDSFATFLNGSAKLQRRVCESSLHAKCYLWNARVFKVRMVCSS